MRRKKFKKREKPNSLVHKYKADLGGFFVSFEKKST